jgi:hypothetical protein
MGTRRTERKDMGDETVSGGTGTSGDSFPAVQAQSIWPGQYSLCFFVGWGGGAMEVDLPPAAWNMWVVAPLLAEEVCRHEPVSQIYIRGEHLTVSQAWYVLGDVLTEDRRRRASGEQPKGGKRA